MKSGIYKIVNLINNKVYIGSSKDYKQRLRQHRNQLKSKVHCNNHLQSSYNKNGVSNFKFELIELCNKNELIDKEKYYINLFDCLNPLKGYNKATIIENTSGYKWSEESKIKLSNSKKGIKMHSNTLKALIKANKNRIYNKGYKQSKEQIENSRIGRMIPILQYSLDGVFIKEWRSANDAYKDLNFKTDSVIRTCVRGERNAYMNFQWLPKKDKYPLQIPKAIRRKGSNLNEFLRLCLEMNIEKLDKLLETPK